MSSDGWLFDVYPLRDMMVVWLYQDTGTLLRLEDPFRPRLYAHAPRDDLRKLAGAALGMGMCSRCLLTNEQEFWSGEMVSVVALEVADYARLP
jgi:hypothetical protein